MPRRSRFAEPPPTTSDASLAVVSGVLAVLLGLGLAALGTIQPVYPADVPTDDVRVTQHVLTGLRLVGGLVVVAGGALLSGGLVEWVRARRRAAGRRLPPGSGDGSSSSDWSASSPVVYGDLGHGSGGDSGGGGDYGGGGDSGGGGGDSGGW